MDPKFATQIQIPVFNLDSRARSQYHGFDNRLDVYTRCTLLSEEHEKGNASGYDFKQRSEQLDHVTFAHSSGDC